MHCAGASGAAFPVLVLLRTRGAPEAGSPKRRTAVGAVFLDPLTLPADPFSSVSRARSRKSRPGVCFPFTIAHQLLLTAR